MKHIGTFAIWYDTAVPGWVAVNDKQQQSFGKGAKEKEKRPDMPYVKHFPR